MTADLEDDARVENVGARGTESANAVRSEEWIRMTEANAVQIIANALPQVWSDLWASRQTPAAFQHNAWTKPTTYFRGAAELERIAPGLTGLCPLFERNGEAIIGWLQESDRYVQFYYEDGRQGDAAIEVLGRNYQQFLLALCIELEDAGMRAEWLELADAARFNHSAELAAALDQDPFDERELDALRDRIGPADRDAEIKKGRREKEEGRRKKGRRNLNAR